MQDPDNLERIFVDPKKNYMPPLRSDLAAREKILSETPSSRIQPNFFKLLPKRIEINLLLV